MSVVEGIMDQKLLRTTNNEGEMIEEVTDNQACTAQDGETNNSTRSESLESPGSRSRSSEGSRSSGSSLGTASMDAESIGIIQSPEHKRQRSSRKKKLLSESIRRHLDNQRFSQLQQTNESVTHHSESSAVDSTASPPPLPQTPTKIDNTDDELLTPRSPTPPHDTTDPESQYKGKSLPPKDTEHLSTAGTISHRRGSKG